ncbi:MAG: AMP-binding protein, partial [bacterium]|nr:AMP-binding protein [bacterium]
VCIPDTINRAPTMTKTFLHPHLSPRVNAPVTSLAYVIYTSGTTGKPKGTMIRHYSLINRPNWMQKKYPIAGNDTLLQKTPFTFDVSVWEIFWWSMTGARLCLMVPGGEKDPEAIIDTITRHRVTTLHFVPSMLSVFLDYLQENKNKYEKQLSSLKQVIASGEALTGGQVNRFKEQLYYTGAVGLANLYGPTEATVDVSYFDCSFTNDFATIPIGKPIDNICLYVMDNAFHLQPVGVTGQLVISGVGLGRGYLNRPE